MTSDEVRQALGLLPWAEHEAWVRADPDIPPGRREGRTLRMICDALAAVSEGKRVRFAAYTLRETGKITRGAKQSAARLGLDQALILDGLTFAQAERAAARPGGMDEDRTLLFNDHFRPSLAEGVFDSAGGAMSIDLPATPEGLTDLMRQVEAQARRLADELDRKTLESRPEAVQQAVREAVTALHLYGPHDRGTRGCLFRIVEVLAPEISRIIEREDLATAMRVVNGET